MIYMRVSAEVSRLVSLTSPYIRARPLNEPLILGSLLQKGTGLISTRLREGAMRPLTERLCSSQRGLRPAACAFKMLENMWGVNVKIVSTLDAQGNASLHLCDLT